MAYSRYEYGTSPRKIKEDYEKPNKKTGKTRTASRVTKNNNTKVTKLKKAKIVSYVALGFASLFLISYRYAVIDKTYSNLKSLRTDLGLIEKETAQLEANIESSLNLTKIEQEAKEKLGMQKLSTSQIVYVTLPKVDYVETSASEVTNDEKSTNVIMDILSKILDIIR